MKLRYDNKRTVRTITLLDVERVKSLSPKCAELHLVEKDYVFQVLLHGGHVDSEPTAIVALDEQPSIQEIFRKFAPCNMPVHSADFYAKIKHGTWLHDFLVGDHRAPAFCETGVCKIFFANGEQRECYLYLRPISDTERGRAIQRAQAAGLTIAKPPPAKSEAAAMLRDNLVVSAGAIPDGPIGDAFRKLDPDSRQLINLRCRADANGRRLTWARVAREFRRMGKEGKEYSGQRCQQIFAAAIKANPELESLFSRKRVSLEAQSEKPDREAIEAATGWNRSQFDIGDLGGDDEDQTARFRATKNPRKPLNLQNPKKK